MSNPSRLGFPNFSIMTTSQTTFTHYGNSGNRSLFMRVKFDWIGKEVSHLAIVGLHYGFGAFLLAGSEVYRLVL